MHVADSMGFTVNTFTHILEGYKVALSYEDAAKIIAEKSTEATEGSVILPPPWNPDKYKTVDDWLNSKEYQEYLKNKKEQ